jgi:hypothetical protein
VLLAGFFLDLEAEQHSGVVDEPEVAFQISACPRFIRSISRLGSSLPSNQDSTAGLHCLSIRSRLVSSLSVPVKRANMSCPLPAKVAVARPIRASGCVRWVKNQIVPSASLSSCAVIGTAVCGSLSSWRKTNGLSASAIQNLRLSSEGLLMGSPFRWQRSMLKEGSGTQRLGGKWPQPIAGKEEWEHKENAGVDSTWTSLPSPPPAG